MLKYHCTRSGLPNSLFFFSWWYLFFQNGFNHMNRSVCSCGSMTGGAVVTGGVVAVGVAGMADAAGTAAIESNNRFQHPGAMAVPVEAVLEIFPGNFMN